MLDKFDRICLIPHNRRLMHAMIVGYYVDDDGFATDANGNSLGERFPGEFIGCDRDITSRPENNPKLVPYQAADEVVREVGEKRVVDLVDETGNFFMRVRGSDFRLIVHFINAVDIRIGADIIELYTILACSGLSHAFTPAEIADAILCYEPHRMPYYLDRTYLDRVLNQQIKDYGMLNLAKLRGIMHVDGTRYGRDFSESQINQLINMFSPHDNWQAAFPMKSLTDWRGSVGQAILPMKYKDSGRRLVVMKENEDAKYENYLLAAKHLIISPACEKIMNVLVLLRTRAGMPGYIGRSELWDRLYDAVLEWQDQ